MNGILCVLDLPIKREIDGFFLKDASGPSRMPRVDVAKFMVDCFPQSELFKKGVAIGF